jgi:hypothetical protein
MPFSGASAASAGAWKSLNFERFTQSLVSRCSAMISAFDLFTN